MSSSKGSSGALASGSEEAMQVPATYNFLLSSFVCLWSVVARLRGVQPSSRLCSDVGPGVGTRHLESPRKPDSDVM